MGFFYFDESIHDRAGFILGAWVYSQCNLTPLVNKAIEEAGLQPGVDEFKSGARMDSDKKQHLLRDKLNEMLFRVRPRLGAVVVPASARHVLGDEALAGLSKILRANSMDTESHDVFVDQGVSSGRRHEVVQQFEADFPCRVQLDQDSRLVSGLQVADLAAHTMSIMLLGTLGLVTKKVKAGPNSGYDPDLDIELGFELWASVRYWFFCCDLKKSDGDDTMEEATVDVSSRGLYIASSCSKELRGAAEARFGKMYLGCIH